MNRESKLLRVLTRIYSSENEVNDLLYYDIVFKVCFILLFHELPRSVFCFPSL